MARIILDNINGDFKENFKGFVQMKTTYDMTNYIKNAIRMQLLKDGWDETYLNEVLPVNEKHSTDFSKVLK